MRGILRLGLMMLLAAAAGVGIARGEWKDYTPGTPGAIAWEYEQIDATSCRIKPKDKNAIGPKVEIPEEANGLTVVEIAKDAFESRYIMKEVKFPSGLTTIGESAFLNCKLTAVEFPDGLTTIEESAFYNCDSLKKVEFPNGLITIGKQAFYNCDSLKKVSISSSVREIGDNAFSDCKELTAFEVDEENASYSQDGGVLFTKGRDTLVSYPGGRKGAYEIPGSVTGIKAGAFYDCQGLTAVVIPGSVKSIEELTFFSCTGLTAVTISDGVTEIVGATFRSCKNLTKVTIPGSVTAMKGSTFYDCSGLNAVYWLADAKCNVDRYAFNKIASPATLYVRPGEETKIKGNGQTWWQVFSKIEVGHVVTFLDGEGNKLGEQLVESNGKATAPTAPTREGYTFDGWQLDGAKYDFSTPVTKDITLVEVWKQNFTVTFDAKGGTPTPDAQTVVKDGTATAPTAPTKEGYTFDGWQLDGKKYDFSTKVTKDITLVAVWKKNEESTPDNSETAVESVQLEAVRVVRNPVGAALELEGMERAARVEVYSVAGAQVYAEALHGEPRVVIDAQGWASGVYVVRVEASDGAKTLRVVK